MAVFSFEWRSGAKSGPLTPPASDDTVWYEDESETFKKGFPVEIDLTKSSAGTVVFEQMSAYTRYILFIASRDAGTTAADVDMDDYTVAGDRPFLVQSNDIWSVSLSASGVDGSPSADNLGALYGWIAHATTTTKAVLDSDDTTYKHWAVVGFDDRDAIGTAGGRLLVMYIGGQDGALTAAAA